MVFTPFCSACFSFSNDGPYIIVQAHSCDFSSGIFQYFAFFSTVWTVFGKPKTDSCSWVHFTSDGTIFGNCQNFHFRSISFCGLNPQIFSIVANLSTHPGAPPILSMGLSIVPLMIPQYCPQLSMAPLMTPQYCPQLSIVPLMTPQYCPWLSMVH